MFKVALVGYKTGVLPLQSFNTKEEADIYILKIAEKEGVKTGYIENSDTKEREKIEDMK
jgi:hypothetical protein